MISILSEKCEVSKKQADCLIETALETITNTLKSGGEVAFAGFGTFSSKKRAGRVGVNPQNPSQKIQIPPVTVPKFKAGKTLKDALKKDAMKK